MIDFIFIRSNKNNSNNLIKKYKSIVVHDIGVLYFHAKKSKEINFRDHKYIVIGDFWEESGIEGRSFNEIIYSLKGIYYILEFGDHVRIASSLFNLLPIYFTKNADQVSSSFALLAENYTADAEIDKKFILEQLLFNYGFFNRTLVKNISLLPCNHHLVLNADSFSMERHYDIRNSFHSSKDISVKTRKEMAGLLIDIAKGYFPNEPFDISFTSGFDGRTIVSCALDSKKDFKTFSYGKIGNDDVDIPMRNAKELGIPYELIDLSKDDYLSEYMDCSLKLVREFGGFNGFIYSHFLYSAKLVSQRSNYLFTGYMGSEIFRTSHMSGAVVAQALYDLFARDNDESREVISNSPMLETLNMERFNSDLKELVGELIDYRSSLPSGLTLNQQFYVFVFEEIFRKVFGVWTKAQMEHINVRLPFIDIRFVESLLKTGFAGANNDFYTNNPIKRHKGQLIYGEIIKRNSPAISRQKTGKGYRPTDLVDLFGWVHIMSPYIVKRIRRRMQATDFDNLSIISGVLRNREFLQNYFGKNSLFKEKTMSEMFSGFAPLMNEKLRDNLLASLSLVIEIDHLLKK
ncbi:MAG TPA: hypothetical protein VMW95_03015 [Desulfobacterales bacterium]|nr:hypothetical protein [Desulfobacterales bacterium]